MYHEFKNITNATILQVPYAEALLNLSSIDSNTIGKNTLKRPWYSTGIIISKLHEWLSLGLGMHWVVFQS